MQRKDTELLFSASDLVRFLGCRHATTLDLQHLETPRPVDEGDEHAELIREKGLEHERAYLESLKAQGLNVVEIPDDGPLGDRVARTAAVMAEGPDIIFQAALRHGPWHGYADFLRRVEEPSELGDYGYEAVDTKLSRHAAASQVLQLCVYTELIARVQGSVPRRMHLVLGDGREASFRYADLRYYYEGIRQSFEGFCGAPPADSYPEPCAQCERCRWQATGCRPRWEADDHLSGVANIRRSQIQKLRAAGIETVRALAELPEGERVAGMDTSTLARLSQQAGLQVHRRDTGEDHFDLLPQEPGRGLSRLPRPDAGDLFFDIEGDPLYPDGLEYLLGLYGIDDGQPWFEPLWAHDHEAEKRAFEALMDRLMSRLRAHPQAHVYHYNHYEVTALKRLASRYGTREAALDALLRAGKFVDLYPVVTQGLRVSEPRYSLKNLERFYMQDREAEVTTAVGSIVEYERWRTTGEAALLEQIADYNEEDCRSTLLLRDWLLELRPEGLPWPGEGDEPDEAELERETEQEMRYQDYRQRLLEGAPEAEREQRELVADLLEFHRREAKPQWWAWFERMGAETEDLIADVECLGGLRADPSQPPFTVKQSLVTTYSYPAQETKLAKGDSVHFASDGQRAGTIFALDERARRVQLKRGQRSGPLPPTLSLMPGGPIKTDALRDAIYRYADAMLEGADRYPAVRDLLDRARPRLDGVAGGLSIVPASAEMPDDAIAAVAGMDGSYLFIQGPPGAGKTYTSSHVIVELLARGKKVGVASNSHKAIHNLLSAVEKRAVERELSFRGVKKSSGPATHFDGRFIRNVTSTGQVDPSADLIAGTAWLFARPEWDQQLDYLFVDEAGQVSLANTVAMGLSARNLVLVGDQMQLGQPLQGTHPGESGVSALEHLLREDSVVPPDRGIFLDTTWRMHPAVCRFISDAVYDGRLLPEAHTQNRELRTEGVEGLELPPAGIRFVPVVHAGCSQRSEEEGAVVKGLYQRLMGLRHTDAEGAEHRLSHDNVVIVSPYNMQVNYLQSILPEGARVGTVDKFQGQEAEVVIVSMATSSGEELPRDIEFLYSRNRLNVALSRARCLAVVVASPRLLEVPCNTVEQMKLVNTLCWVRDYAARQAGATCD